MNKFLAAPLVGSLLLGGVILAADSDVALERSRTLSKALVEQLGATLKKELAERGPEAAIEVCKSMATELAAQLSRQHGARVSRVSLRVRNALLGSPDSWEQTGLRELEQRLVNGEQGERLELWEAVSEPAGKYFRYLRAIPVQPLCLTCHGSPESIPDGVKARLEKDYPHDRAVGYSAGQLRGAVSVKLPQ